MLLAFGGRYNRYFWDTRMKILKLSNFYMLFHLVLTKFFKSELFSCLLKVNHVIKSCKEPIQNANHFFIVFGASISGFPSWSCMFSFKNLKHSSGCFVDQMLFVLTIAFLRVRNCQYLSSLRKESPLGEMRGGRWHPYSLRRQVLFEKDQLTIQQIAEDHEPRD